MLTFQIFQFLLITVILKIVFVDGVPVNRKSIKLLNVICTAGIFFYYVSTEQEKMAYSTLFSLQVQI